jgi:FAD/FMN-containing dehydrogenase
MVGRLAAMPGLRAFGVFGHVGDGNIHVITVGDDADEADRVVFAAVADYGGSISAEHGVGRAKSHVLHLCRSVTEIEVMRAVKNALDPHGLLNPGVLLPATSSSSAI